MKSFTTREVAKILGLTDQRIRSCVRAGFLKPERGPGGEWRFAFQDLLLLKTTKGLLDSRIPTRKILRMLASLRRQLPDDQHLSSVTIYADGRRIVAWDGRARWQPDSGQFLFNFDVQTVAREVDLPLPARADEAPALTAEHWFTVASELERSSPEEARRAYRHALELEPAMADAHVNLGRLCHEAREYDKAEAHYRAAIGHAPDDPVARFNLGVLMEDIGRSDEAAGTYREAIALSPDYADAHYNLGLLCEKLGRRAEAISHLRRARALYGRTSPNQG